MVLRIVYLTSITSDIPVQLGNKISTSSRILRIKYFGSEGNKFLYAALVQCSDRSSCHNWEIPESKIVAEKNIIFSKLHSLALNHSGTDLRDVANRNLLRKLKKDRRKQNNRSLTEDNWTQFVRRKEAIRFASTDI
ncbi:hypothetical protein AB6864_06660 [Serratia proteamaculans]|uniref:hypothetical protein n=1 Tax=Serratia proteamaculans TaxID=28151 RepID=UPI0021795A85|nr:hypothetical protein [Serratia proteamaculans]CAI1826554.1 Uncharacterised protein [Serratia proteamaculans]CAI2409596.1 Uncharacterised protein [Serratia proteamaculans]